MAMHSSLPQETRLLPILWSILLSVLLGLGLLFRIADLDQKVFWVDEVATAIRAVGYTKAEVIAQLADGMPHSAAELLSYQRLAPERSLNHTLHALVHSPEHAPLYFMLTRLWMQGFGSSVSAIRSLSVLCSLLVLPGIYWLGRELFAAAEAGWTAMALITISPFFIAYAQEARPYSLWLLTFVLAEAALLRALRLNFAASWLVYAVLLTLSCYTSLLSLLLLVGQGIYVILVRPEATRRLLLTFVLALLAFLPWFWVMLHHQTELAANTTWMRTPTQLLITVAIWLYSLVVIFFDVPIVSLGWMALEQLFGAALVLAILIYAFFNLPPRAGLLTATLGLPVPLTLLLLDLFMQGQAAATPRYLMPLQMGMLLAVAALIAPPWSDKMPLQRWISPMIAVLLLSLSLLSDWGNLNHAPEYQKDRNRHNFAIATLLNQADQPLLIAEPAQTLDLLSLSHQLQPTVQVQILSSAQPVPIAACQSLFLFNPPVTLVAAVQTAGLQLTQLYQPALLTPADAHLTLWQAQTYCNPDRSG
jgi:uncharacterized membrane protein